MHLCYPLPDKTKEIVHFCYLTSAELERRHLPFHFPELLIFFTNFQNKHDDIFIYVQFYAHEIRVFLGHHIELCST